MEGHSVHDSAVNYFILFDQLEWQSGSDGRGASWDARGWVGTDRDRFWFRTEGQGEDGRLDQGQAHLLYGRAIARWWEVVAGVRQDVRPGSPQTWAAIGLQGLAPYRFEVEATAYVGGSGRTQLRLETEYDAAADEPAGSATAGRGRDRRQVRSGAWHRRRSVVG